MRDGFGDGIQDLVNSFPQVILPGPFFDFCIPSRLCLRLVRLCLRLVSSPHHRPHGTPRMRSLVLLVLAGVPLVAPFALPCSPLIIRRGAQATDSLPSVRLAGLAPGRNVRQVQGAASALSMAAAKKSALGKALIKVTGSLTVRSRVPLLCPFNPNLTTNSTTRVGASSCAPRSGPCGNPAPSVSKPDSPRP